MAVPKRKTSKSAKRARRTHKKLSSSSLSYDSILGEYKRSHYISPDGYYKGKKVID